MNEAADRPRMTPKIWHLCLFRRLVNFLQRGTCSQCEIHSSTCYNLAKETRKQQKQTDENSAKCHWAEKSEKKREGRQCFTDMFILSWTLRHSLGVNLGNTEGTKSGFDGSIDTFPVVEFGCMISCQVHSKLSNTVTVTGFQIALVRPQHGCHIWTFFPPTSWFVYM